MSEAAPLSLGRTDRPIPERNTFFPGWADARLVEDASVFEIGVRAADGRDLGFTVGDVAYEYRWPIDPETGTLLSQAEFDPQFDRWQRDFFHFIGEDIPAIRTGCPAVIAFVSRAVHPQDPTQIIHMGDKPGAAMTDRERAQIQQDIRETARPLSEWREAPAAANEDTLKLTRLQTLQELHDAGDISDATYAARVGEILSTSPVEPEATKAEEPAEAPPATPAKPTMLSLCGQTCKGLVGKKTHERNCKACKALAKEAAATPA